MCGNERSVNPRGGLILYAEDDPNDAFLFEMAVRRAGLPYALAVVDDGQAAIDWLAGRGSFADREKNPMPSVLVLDLKMPRKNGFEVLEWIRGHETLKELPVIVVSSSGEARDLERATELGATSYFVKSASSEEVVEYLSGTSV